MVEYASAFQKSALVVKPVSHLTSSSDSCNAYKITGEANDPDRAGAPVKVSIKIDGDYVGQTNTENGRFTFTILNEYKDDVVHDVEVTASNPYTRTVSGITVDNPSIALLDYTSFRCEPPETDLLIIGEAWANQPGRGGAYPDGNAAVDTIWLEDTARFEVVVENIDTVYPALDVEVEIELPLDFDRVLNWNFDTHPDWDCTSSGWIMTCTIDRLESSKTKDKYTAGDLRYTSGDTKYTLIEGHSIVSGDYLPSALGWYANIYSSTDEYDDENNEASFDLEVKKVWMQVKPTTELISQINHVIYHSSITNRLTSSNQQKTFQSNKLIPALYQVPIYQVPGVELKSAEYPKLTVEFCKTYPSNTNCGNRSAVIEGAIRLKSFEFLDTYKQLLEPSRTSLMREPFTVDLQTGPIVLNYGLDGDGRFVDHDPVNCQIWINKMMTLGQRSQCSARYETFSSFLDSQKDNYEMDRSEQFGMLLYSPGGRPQTCGSGCITSNIGKPGIYLTRGIINYEVIFYDDAYQRLGPHPKPFAYSLEFDLYNQQITQFQEMDR